MAIYWKEPTVLKVVFLQRLDWNRFWNQNSEQFEWNFILAFEILTKRHSRLFYRRSDRAHIEKLEKLGLPVSYHWAPGRVYCWPHLAACSSCTKWLEAPLPDGLDHRPADLQWQPGGVWLRARTGACRESMRCIRSARWNEAIYRSYKI